MPWKAREIMSLREEFVLLARQDGANRRALCERFGISPQTGYKWLRRHAEQGASGLVDRSRRPHTSPGLTPAAVEEEVLEVRHAHPQWGGRKISWVLETQGIVRIPPSTVTAILRRHGLISPQAGHRPPWQRFEREAPNALWQVDFKGYFKTPQGTCSPLSMVDDHSRFSVALRACGKTDTSVVKAEFEQTLRQYGLPVQINFDNGSPWGSPSAPGQLTELTVWLVRMGIRISFSRPYHPQTNGKVERFHRSLKAEVLHGRSFETLAHVQTSLDRWRAVYNLQRPHEALGMETPVTRYQPSPQPFPEQLPPLVYADHDTVCRVGWDGALAFRGHRYKLSNALHRQDVAVRPRPAQDGLFDVFFAHHHCLEIDLNNPAVVN